MGFKRTSMLKRLSILTIVIGLLQTDQVEGRCDFQAINSLVSWNETIPAGNLFFNLTKDVGDTVTFDISGRQASGANVLNPKFNDRLKQYFILTTGDTWFALTSNGTLSLEYFHDEWENAVLTTIYLDFDCGVGTEQVTISNEQVNQYKPVFNQSPYSTSVRELENVGTEVYSLTEKVTDRDIPPPSKFYFQILPYNIGQLDGREYFDMPQSRGKVTVKKTLDYDEMDPHYYMLNISVADSAVQYKALTAFTSLNITIIDDNDQNPEFVKPGCSSPCEIPEYEAVVGITDSIHETGAAVVVDPPIIAIDTDSLNAPLNYSIISGNQHKLFWMNSENAAITQQRSVLEAGLPDKEFRLVIEVVKKNQPDLRALAIVRIKVRERMPTFNGTVPTLPPGTDANAPPDKENSDGLLIPVIVLGIILFLIIIAIIIVVILFRRKHKQTMVVPGDTKSEPHTEEEELPIEEEDHYHEQAKSQERLVPTITSGTLLYAEAPSVRAGTLPPLPSRDFATETEDVTKKKRSRRRKKQKEPEIFDGTKEYNMGADPEFFDSTDKSKVKRSTRSYPKETDPQLRLTVPNDEPQNE